MDRNKLLKGAASLALVFVLCIIGSKLLFGSSETLDEYALKNPEAAYADNKEKKEESKMDPSVKEPLDADEKVDYITNDNPDPLISISSNDSNNLSQTDPIINEMVLQDKDFVEIEDGFYYGNLSEKLKENITGISYPIEGGEITYGELRYLHVLHFDFNGEIQSGELICNQAVAQDLAEIFYALYQAEYQLEKIKLIDEYQGDDDASMEDNNTSCFNYRVVDNTTKLSKHAFGLAVDVNPFYNPYVRYNKDGSLYVAPDGSDAYANRNTNFPYKIDHDDLCYRLFLEKGFVWGGDWNSSKDYQHFQKTLP